VLIRSQFPSVQRKNSWKALYVHLPKEGGSFTGDPGLCVREDSGDGHLSPKRPLWRNWKEARIPGTLKDN
jgi:hypothetical protein